MRFHNSRAIVKQGTNVNTQQTNQMTSMPLRMTRIPSARKTNDENKPTNDIRTHFKPKENKMKWGEPIWFLFHVLAEKIQEEHFSSKKYELINLVKAICANLPCPTCTDHATAYMKKLNIDSIKSKQDWKDFLYKFHNDVNKRKNYPEFPHNELDTKYNSANTVNVINYFLAIYREKSGNVQMIATEMSRKRVLRNAQQWLKNNLSCFDT